MEMSSLQHYQHYFTRMFTRDRSTKHCIRLSLKVANYVMAITGIAILMYSFWMFVVCLREYHNHHKHLFPWFLWACIGVGIAFTFIACIGHAGAHTRNNLLLSLYILLLFLLMLVESLIIGDICLNDDWDKDFPKDHTDRFDDFVDYVDDNRHIFRGLALLIGFSQVSAFFLAMVLRTMEHRRGLISRSLDGEVNNSATLPFLHHHTQQYPAESPYYAVCHPDPAQYYPAPSPPYAAEVKGNDQKPVPAIPKGY